MTDKREKRPRPDEGKAGAGGSKARCRDRINNHQRREEKMGFITERGKQTFPGLPTLLATPSAGTFQ